MTSLAKEKNIGKFDRDVLWNKSYLYTVPDRLSSVLANRTLSQAIQGMGDFHGKRVLDLGCGDGTYTLELADLGPSYLLGLDASRRAIRLAQSRSKGRKRIVFRVRDIYKVDSLQPRFQVAVARGILHHLYEAPKAIAAICRIADEVIVVEPNGYNPVLKMIEKLSPYHRSHEEKSYSPADLRRWFEKSGARVVQDGYFGLVPFFCPNWIARLCKFLEPFFEAVPGLKQLSCAVYVFKVSTGSRKVP